MNNLVAFWRFVFNSNSKKSDLLSVHFTLVKAIHYWNLWELQRIQCSLGLYNLEAQFHFEGIQFFITSFIILFQSSKQENLLGFRNSTNLIVNSLNMCSSFQLFTYLYCNFVSFILSNIKCYIYIYTHTYYLTWQLGHPLKLLYTSCSQISPCKS